MTDNFNEVIWWGLIELHFDLVLCQGFVFLDHLLDLIFGQNIHNGAGLVAHLQHASRVAIVSLHASEVPAGELIHIDDTVPVQVKVCHCCCKLLFTKRLAEFFRKFSKLVQINGTVSIFIELIVTRLDNLFEYLGSFVNKFTTSAKQGFNAF